MFAASVSDTKRRSESVSDGVLKVARLAELRARLSPIKSSLSLPVSPDASFEGEHVAGSSPRTHAPAKGSEGDGPAHQTGHAAIPAGSEMPSVSVSGISLFIPPTLPAFDSASTPLPSAVVSSSVIDISMSPAREDLFSAL